MTPSIQSDIRELSAIELGDVAGGLNPQPLPPRWLFGSIFSRFSWVTLNPQPLPPVFKLALFR